MSTYSCSISTSFCLTPSSNAAPILTSFRASSVPRLITSRVSWCGWMTFSSCLNILANSSGNHSPLQFLLQLDKLVCQSHNEPRQNRHRQNPGSTKDRICVVGNFIIFFIFRLRKKTKLLYKKKEKIIKQNFILPPFKE